MTLNKKEKWAIALIVLASIINFIFVAILIFALSKARWYNDPVLLLTMVIPSAYIIPIALFMMFGAAILYKDKPNTQKKVTFIAFLLYFVPFALGILYQVGDIVAYKVRYTFSVEKWRAADQNERGRLINSFRTNHPLVGENISVAKALLGEPDVSGDTYFIFYIGDYDKWLAMDPYYYSITFNSENIITVEEINQS